MEKQPFFRYVKLGLNLQEIRRVRNQNFQETTKSFLALKQLAKEFEFETTQRLVAQLERFFKATYTHSQTSVAQMEELAESILGSLEEETRNRLLLEVDRNVSVRLIELPKRQKLTVSQTHLWEETIRCLERRAYRAGIVMGWALAYDVIRWSTWDDKARLLALEKNWKGRGDLKTDDYEDFITSTMGEWSFLESCKAAKLLGDKSDKMFSKLAECLRERNDYAHANNKSAPTRMALPEFVSHAAKRRFASWRGMVSRSCCLGRRLTARGS